MLRHAQSLDATELTRAGRHLVAVVDPDGLDRSLEAALEREERAAHLGRSLSIIADRAGGVRIRGRGTAEDGALLTAALLPLTRPEPALRHVEAETGETCTQLRDPRDHGARLWDALVTLAQHALDTDRVPETHAVPARLLVTLDHQTLRDTPRSQRSGHHRRRPRPTPRRHPPARVRRRDHPRRVRHPRRGPRRRPHPTTGHPRDVDRPRDPRPALHLPHLHPTPGHVPRPPPHPLDRRRRHQPRQPRPVVRPPPPRHPQLSLGNTPQPR